MGQSLREFKLRVQMIRTHVSDDEAYLRVQANVVDTSESESVGGIDALVVQAGAEGKDSKSSHPRRVWRRGRGRGVWLSTCMANPFDTDS